MWYVVQVVSGHEDQVAQLASKLVDSQVLTECFVLRCNYQKHVKGAWVTENRKLIPGYVFMTTKNVDALQKGLMCIPAFTRLLGNSDSFIPLDESEIRWMESFTTQGSRTIEVSKGFIVGDRVVITSGPLKGHEGEIVKIDRHKRQAYVTTPMFDRETQVKLGLEIVSRQQ